MKVLGVNLIGMLISFLGWAHTTTLDNAVKVLGMSMIGMVLFNFGWLFYRSFYRRKLLLSRVAHVVCNEERDDEPKSCSKGDTLHRSSEGMWNDPILEPKHKIFLSHSGAQKEFVEHLCKALEDRLHYPFFDRRHESLPKGEQFPKLIVQAAEQCEMLIVVVSNEYFMSKWPMIELNAFVRAHKLCRESKSSTNGPKILPLFYGLCVHDLEDASKRKKWFRKWETLAKADPKKRIVVHDWKYALDVLGSFNGIPYDMNLKEIVAYEEKIVSYVCQSIAPDRKWDDSHVQGKSSIHKVIDEKIEGIGVSRRYKVKVVGIFGVGGVGKTTICKTMCNELSSKYEGRVCHIEFPSGPSSDFKELFKRVLQDLTRKSIEVIQQLNEGECKDILRKSLFKQKTFLAIDNISDNHQSIAEAKLFLEIPYHKDSLVVVTARSSSILSLLGLDEVACFEMPDLEEANALNLFLHYAASGKQFLEDEEKHDIMTCISRCYFSKGNGEDYHYHPLALKVLGLQLGCYGENPSLWVKNLPRVRNFNFFPGENPVYDILRSSFDLLPPRDQTMFMDVGCFYKTFNSFQTSRLIEWLCAAHKQNEEQVALQLEHLKQKGLVQDVDLKSKEISVHDLYLEFAELEAEGSFNKSTNFKEQMWMCIKNGDISELECRPEGGCWYKLIRLCITNSLFDIEDHDGIFDQIESMEGIKWDYFSNVEVLQLSGLHWGHGALNVEGLVRLRLFELLDVSKIDRVEGLEKLKHLTYFIWYSANSDDGTSSHIVGQLPRSLRKIDIWGDDVVLGSDLLVQCHNLSSLNFFGVEAHLLDLSNCRSLEHVSLQRIQNLKTLLGLIPYPPSNLHFLMVFDCEDLVDILGINQLNGLKTLHIGGCENWKVPSLFDLSTLEILSILCPQEFMVPTKDCFPYQLRELRWRVSQSYEELNLSGFNKLENLDFCYSNGLTSLLAMGDLPALQCLNLQGCKHLLHLPNLNKSKNLQELGLDGCCALELHEKDIEMLSKLPLLHPILISGKTEDYSIRLDVARRKVLFHSSSSLAPHSWELWKVDEWEEQDLGALPIKIGMISICKLDLVDNKNWNSD